jgi:hypothetical protein
MGTLRVAILPLTAATHVLGSAGSASRSSARQPELVPIGNSQNAPREKADTEKGVRAAAMNGLNFGRDLNFCEIQDARYRM